MQIPVQVSFRNMDRSAAVVRAVRRRAQSLETYHPDIISCRVMVEAPHRRHLRGKLYRVRVDVTVPGREILSRRQPVKHGAHEDVYVAVRDAFDAVRRQLMDQIRHRRGQVKAHEGAVYGRVARLSPEGYGFLETEDVREVYFHANSVLGGFGRLKVGARVRFTEEMGDKGPQASTVALAGKRTRPAVIPHV